MVFTSEFQTEPLMMLSLPMVMFEIQPGKARHPNPSKIKPSSSEIRMELFRLKISFDLYFRIIFPILFRYDYLSLNDDGLLTPNSTVNSITADYTRELILSQNRRSNLLGTNTNSSNGHSNDSISSPPSNSKV